MVSLRFVSSYQHAHLPPLRLVPFSSALGTWKSSDDSGSDSDSDGDNGTRRGPWSRKATKKYILSSLKDGGRAVRAIAVHVEEDQSLTHNAAGPPVVAISALLESVRP